MKTDDKLEPVDLATLCSMLDFISADQPREEWTRLLMAAKSEFGDGAKSVMQAWSATAPSYDKNAFLSTWKSIKASGGVSIGTLIHEAKQNGFRFAPISKEERKRLKAEQRKREAQRKQSEAKERQEREKLQSDAKERAQKLLSERAFLANPEHPYFVKKGINGEVNRLSRVYQFAETLMIPVYQLDKRGEFELCSLQFIGPDGEKFFLKGGLTKGGFYPLRFSGQIVTIVVCEGFATGVTVALHYEPLAEVICAFNARNLAPVARAFKRRYPLARIIIAGDNDRKTEKKTGVNVGVVKASEAARLVDGALLIPEFAEHEAGTDWNDRYLLDLANHTAANEAAGGAAYG
ncbi:PriCT-2 domain-containing protein [Thiomicrorhabdus sp. zzn3]|uniref:PriCT-2 domain-containing protein n=1 Tax=Thiomicrorhabdus sp. zzn3 TaxID=3039775 RepID=UPI0024363CB3|nr:PriCT-2 domain-containing protein [Thiomicrorhabdus sp. zzn3]MDG6777689.1 PriCT-2 domain-containing protein [Thiomicrorhabdus sp. zzn3]